MFDLTEPANLLGSVTITLLGALGLGRVVQRAWRPTILWETVAMVSTVFAGYALTAADKLSASSLAVLAGMVGGAITLPHLDRRFLRGGHPDQR